MARWNDAVLSRRAFLKLGLGSLSATALLFLSACSGEEDEDEGDEQEDD